MKRIIKYCLATLLLVLCCSAANAAVIIVNDTADVAPSFAGGVILRDAVATAGPNDTIIIDVSGTILLTGGPIQINQPIVIGGPEPIHMTIDGNGNQAFYIDNQAAGGTVVLYGVTITNSAINAAFELNTGANAYLSHVVFTNNSGRALLNNGVVNLENCSFINNDGASDGAAFRNLSGGSASFVNCTFGHNDSGSHGGAVYNLGGQIDFEWCTIVYNSAPGGQGGGIQNFSGLITMRNTIVADNTSGGGGDQNLGAGAGSYASNGYNLITSFSPPMTANTGDQFNGSVLTYLATAPQMNGFGMIIYPIISTNSPAIDAGTNTAGVSLDARRAPRVLDGRGIGSFIADKGAVEWSPLCVDQLSGTGSFDDIMGQIYSNTYQAPHYICFDIPGAGPHTIYPGSGYYYTQQVIVDGYSQPGSKIAGPGSTGNEITPAYVPIELDGVGGLSVALDLQNANSEYSEIRGLTIYNYTQAGILLGDEECEVYGNHIGFNNSWTNLPCGAGVMIGLGVGSFSANRNIIGGSDYFKINVISGQTGANIFVNNDAGTQNVIAHNFIGTAPDGVNIIDPGYSAHGVLLMGGTNTNIGDPHNGGGNLISGNQHGISYQNVGSYNDTIAGNIIGLDLKGNNILGNGVDGINIVFDANFIVIGGLDDSYHNVISGNGASGIDVSSSNVEIYRNIIGLDKSGLNPAGNLNYGVYVHAGAQGNFIGRPDNGNTISANGESGIRISDASTNANTVQGNIIGMAADQTTQRGNGGDAISILFGAANTLVGGTSDNNEGNLISGNSGFYGVRVQGPQTTIQGNVIGLDGTGAVAAPNSSGVYISGVGTTSIGGLGSGEGNIISGNNGSGIYMLNSVTSVTVYGNIIGLDATGATAVPNTAAGLYCNDVNDLIIGNGTAAGRNIISGNGQQGIALTGTGVSSCAISGNIIGLAADGDTDRGNSWSGIYMDNSSGVTIGSTSGAAKSVISGNGLNGLEIGTGNSSISVVNCIIGENEVLSATRMNSQVGIEIHSGSTNVSIGGTTNTSGNRIIGNGEDGIRISGAGTVSNPINQNVIYSNGGNDNNHLEIDLVGGNGVDVNDSGDGDAGANDLLNYPVLEDATADCNGGGTSIVKGSLNSVGSTTFRIEYFSIAPALVDPGGHGGGEVYLGHQDVTTTAAGDATFTFTYPGVLTAGDFITATSTELFLGAPLQTSEFSEAVEIHATPGGINWVETSETCAGFNDGKIYVSTFTGGASPITYLWSDGQGTDTAFALPPGSYTVTVTDTNGCTATSPNITVNPAAAILFTVTPTDVTCNGLSDGSIIFSSVSGGTSPYQYSIDGGVVYQTSPTFTGVAPGTYNCIVLDNNGCTATQIVTVTEPAALTVATTSTDVSCFGANDGTISASATGGTPSYSYFWTPGGYGTAGVSALGPATYSVTVTDANGCTALNSAIVNEPSQITFTTSEVDATCGASNGSITVNTPSGGTGAPYSYQFDGGGFSASNTLTGLPGGGTHSVDVQDASGCWETVNVNIVNLPGPNLDSIVYVEPTCFGDTDGSITVYLSPAALLPANPYTTDGGATYQASNTFNGLGAGSHTVGVIDTNACYYDTALVLGQPTIIVITEDSVVDASCNGACDGGVYISVTGGTPGYTYDLGGDPNGPSWTSECAGTAIITVTDAAGCPMGHVTNVGEPALENASFSYPNSSYCIGSGNGTATATLSGTSGGTYGAPAGVSINTATGAIDLSTSTATGSVTITYTTPCGVIGNQILTLNLPDDPSFNFANDTFCIADPNPTPTITGLSGGTFSSPSAGITIANTSTGEIDLGNTIVGNFTIVYTTNGPCPTSDSVVVTVESIQSIGMNSAGPFCESDGMQTLSATPAGGTWSASCGACIDSNTGVFTPGTASAGTHTIYYSAGAGNCVGIDSISIVVLAAPTYTISGGGSYCAGDNPPNIDVVFTSGAYPLLVDINQGGSLFLDDDVVTVSTVQYSGLPAGDYEIVYVIDNNGCFNTATSTTITITEIPLPPTPTCSSDQTICDGDAIPGLSATGSGSGVIEWFDDNTFSNNIATGTTLSPAAHTTGPGIYWFYAIEDNSGCVSLADSVQLTIVATPSAPTANTTLFTYCEGEAILAITATPSSGGTFTWYDDAALTNQVGTGLTYLPSQNLTGLNAFYVTESVGGCESAALIIEINVETAATGDAGADQEICLGSTAQLLATGGASYVWNPSSDLNDLNIADPIASPDTTETFYVLITSANGCSFMDSVTVTVIDGEDCGFVIYNAYSPDGDGTNDTWVIEGIEQYTTNRVQIFNRWGDKLNDFENYNNTDVVWDGTNDGGDLLPAGTYYYIIDIEDGTRTFNGWVYLSK